MFVKTSENQWMNLPRCTEIKIRMNKSEDWVIEFYPRGGVKPYSIGTFSSEREAHEVLDEIWEYYREGKPYFEPDPRKKMNVKLGDKWYADDKYIDTYLEVIQRLGLEEIETRVLTYKTKHTQEYEEYPVVTKDKVQGLNQSKAGEYYILLLEFPSSMKETLEYIASELGVCIKVTIY